MAAIGISATIAPRLEIYLKLACQVRPALGTVGFLQLTLSSRQEIRPDYESISIKPGSVIDWPTGFGLVAIPPPSVKCKSDPEVQVSGLSHNETAFLNSQ
jgi:hypothetical protein